MPTLYITQKGELALQDAGLAGWTLLHVDLCTVLPAPPARQAVIGDFTKAAFTGYAQAAVTMTAGLVDGINGPVYALSDLSTFNGPTSGAGSDVLGGVYSDGTTHDVWAWFTFDANESLNFPTDIVAFVLKLFQNETYSIDVIE